MYHNASRSQRFPNLIFQDVPRFQKVIFRTVLRFQDSSPIIQTYQQVSKLFPKTCQIYDSLLRFQDHRKCFRISKMLLRFRLVVFLATVHANCFDPTDVFRFLSPPFPSIDRQDMSTPTCPKTFKMFGFQHIVIYEYNIARKCL